MSAVVEVCVDSIESALAAASGGAHRLEVCAALSEGGLTPSLGLVAQILQIVRPSVQVHVMLRPRAGDFLYSSREWNVMLEDLRQFQRHFRGAAKQADGFVLGCLTRSGTIDTKRLLTFAQFVPKDMLTFHRAIDMAQDPIAALDQLITLDVVGRVLTSGGAVSAVEGVDVIMKMNQRVADRGSTLVIAAGGGLTETNVGEVMAQTGVSHVHGSLRLLRWGGMQFRRSGLSMGATSDSLETEYAVKVADKVRVRAFVKAAKKVAKKSLKPMSPLNKRRASKQLRSKSLVQGARIAKKPAAKQMR